MVALLAQLRLWEEMSSQCVPSAKMASIFWGIWHSHQTTPPGTHTAYQTAARLTRPTQTRRMELVTVRI